MITKWQDLDSAPQDGEIFEVMRKSHYTGMPEITVHFWQTAEHFTGFNPSLPVNIPAKWRYLDLPNE